MDLELKGHVAVVQGASRGIGRGIAEALAAEGCDLVLTARGKEDLGRAVTEVGERTGRRVLGYPMDSAELAAQAGLVDFVEKEFGRLDVIVANSGGPAPGTMADLAAAQWEEAARLLVVAPVELLRAALPLLGRSPAARFFFVTSTSTVVPFPGLTLSNVFRPAIVGLVKTLTEELAPQGVVLHSIAPGRIDTDRLANVFRFQAEKSETTAEALRAAAEASIPAGRIGAPGDVGSLVAYLSSMRADYLRGGNWLVDGGLVRVL